MIVNDRKVKRTKYHGYPTDNVDDRSQTLKSGLALEIFDIHKGNCWVKTIVYKQVISRKIKIENTAIYLNTRIEVINLRVEA